MGNYDNLKLEYTKDWRDPMDFPTIETSEEKVREDIQCLYEEAKNALNNLIDALGGADAASTTGIEEISGLDADNVQDALEELSDEKSPINSPTFTGSPQITTTPLAGDDSHKIADTAFVQREIARQTPPPDVVVIDYAEASEDLWLDVREAYDDGKHIVLRIPPNYSSSLLVDKYLNLTSYQTTTNSFPQREKFYFSSIYGDTEEIYCLQRYGSNYSWDSARQMLLAPINSPTFTGSPQITTTPLAGDDSHKIADTAFVQREVAGYMQKGVDYVTAGKKANTTLGSKATAEGERTTASGPASHAEGRDTIASGDYAHAEGMETTASGDYAHAEGRATTASGDYSHAEGEATEGSAEYAHAEGSGAVASGLASHAEGFNTTASEYEAHAEGIYTTASGRASHAEGGDSVAFGMTSHAEGKGTQATRRSQHVFGEYNIVDIEGDPSGEERGHYLEIVGNGEDASHRSNARTLDWDGNEVLAGKLILGVGPTRNMDAATKKYVDDAIAAAIAALQ